MYVFPGILHGSGHAISVVFENLAPLINTSGYEYNMMIRNISCFKGYLAGGDICAGTELLYKMVHQLSDFLYILIAMIVCCVVVFCHLEIVVLLNKHLQKIQYLLI